MAPYVIVALTAVVLAWTSALVSRRLASPAGMTTTRFASPPIAGRLWTPFDFLVVAVLVSFSALRYQVGTDYPMYARFYDQVDPRLDLWTQVDRFQQEVLYTGMSVFLKTITDSPYAIFWAASILTVVPIYATLRKLSRDLPLAVLLYILLAFYLQPFNVLRQGISIALLFWAYSFLTRRTWPMFALIAAAASMFHTSALLAAGIMVAARFWKPGPRSATIAFIGGALGSVALWQLPVVASIVASFSDKYERYVVGAEAAGFGTYLLVAAYFAFTVMVLAMRRYNDRPDWLAFVIIGVVFIMLGTQSLVATRMFDYFGIFVLLLIPNVLSERPNSRAIKTAIIVGAAAYFVLYLANYGELLPYRTYL